MAITKTELVASIASATGESQATVGRVVDGLFAAVSEAVAKGVAVHITKQKIVLDGSLQAEIMATVLGLAARIEREFIRARTTEALRVAKANGKRLGRPPGQAAALKLDERADEVAAYLALGLSLTKAAARLEVSKATLSRFIKRRKIKPAKHVEVKGNG